MSTRVRERHSTIIDVPSPFAPADERESFVKRMESRGPLDADAVAALAEYRSDMATFAAHNEQLQRAG